MIRRARPGDRGFTLLESMIAIGIVLLAAMGLASAYVQGVGLTGDSRRKTQAVAIAQDLLNNIALWDYTSAALANATTSNDADIADTARAFETTADPLASGLADHGEATLTGLGAAWTGLPTSALGGVYERYWNVVYIDTNSDGTADLVEIAVIVRWQQSGTWRRIVLLGAKTNPAAI